LQQPRKFANGLLGILNVLQPFEAGDVLEGPITERQVLIQITAMYFHTVQTENLRVEVTALHFKTRCDQLSRECALSGRDIQQRSPRLPIQNAHHLVMNRLMSQRRRGFAARRRVGADHWPRRFRLQSFR